MILSPVSSEFFSEQFEQQYQSLMGWNDANLSTIIYRDFLLSVELTLASSNCLPIFYHSLGNRFLKKTDSCPTSWIVLVIRANKPHFVAACLRQQLIFIFDIYYYIIIIIYSSWF